MSNSKQDSNSAKGVALSLPAELTISNNGILKEKLERIIDKGYEKAIIDLSKVDKMDLSSMQILMSFIRVIFDTKGSVVFYGPLKKSLIKTLDECGFLRTAANGEMYMFPFISGKGVKLGYR